MKSGMGAVLALALGMGIAVGGGLGIARADDPALEPCLPAVGTFLISNEKAGDKAVASRSLLSLTSDGNAFFSDSREAGDTSYPPFSDGRGAWMCGTVEDGKVNLAALILDFTFTGKAGDPQEIARLDMSASFDAQKQILSGTTTLSFVPLDGDPFDMNALSGQATFDFTGQKVVMP